jgi:hypothetical protein
MKGTPVRELLTYSDSDPAHRTAQRGYPIVAGNTNPQDLEPEGGTMAEVSRTRRGELVRGVFTILLPHPDGLPAKLVLERLSTVVPPTSFEQSTYPKRPGIRRYEKIVRFSTIAAVKAGWLTKNKGL